MNYKEFYCLLPIKDNNVKIIDGIVQYDTANIIHVRLMDGSKPFNFTGYTEVILEVLKPDGNHIQVLVTDDPEVNDDNNPYWLQVIDPDDGRISFILQGQATILTGTHFAQLSVMGEGKMLTSARINYYVGDTLSSDTDPDDVVSSGEYTTLQTLINRNSAIATEERNRIDAETLRKEAEQKREERMDEMEEDLQEYLEKADSYVEQTKENMEQAKHYAELAQNPSAEIMEELIQAMDLATNTYTEQLIFDATKDFDAGSYTDTEEEKKLLVVRNGEDVNVPSLAVGEMGFSVDTERLYIGGQDGNVPLNGTYAAQPTPPDETHLLWIDTSASGGGAIKYYDGSTWQPTATAVFS